VVKTEKNTLILDAYNANPGSMKTAIETFAASSYPEKVVILGDMLELGMETETEHLAILHLIGQYEFKHVMLVGPVFTALNTRRDTLCFADSALARMWLDHHRIENTTILIKGSRGIRLEVLAEVL
jgi:UDP-N-acetylmuramoyl-tripeptide--D-alanyl-D-alanine ligase